VLWKRDAGIAVHPEDLQREWISGVRVLLVDGHDTKASAEAARWAHEEKIPVVGDFDNRYTGVKELLEVTDFPITSKDFPERFTGEADLLKSLPMLFRASGCRLIIATMGGLGALAWDGARFLLCPGFRVEAVDTTGAGDIFHGAFLYALVHGWEVKDALEFCCAAAALNCKALGARGGIAPLDEIESLRRTGERSELAYEPEVLLEAACVQTAGARP
jgi:sulfofructose kinase